MTDHKHKVLCKMRDKYDTIIEITDAVCDEHLGDEDDEPYMEGPRRSGRRPPGRT